MIGISAQQVQAPQYTYIEGLEEESATKVRAQSSPEPTNHQSFKFQQKYIPADGNASVIELTETPKLIVDKRTMEFEVEGWGIRLLCSQVHELPRHMSRRFMELFSKADSEALLNEEEASLWFSILGQVNYDRFCYDRAAPQYMEGELIRRFPTVVKWYDGKTENLSNAVARSLSLLEPGETFRAFVKLDGNNLTRGIERVTIKTNALEAEATA